jgi:hypothetical protein
MTITLTQKMFIAAVLALGFVAPGFAHAEESTTAKLQTQYQMLMERFEKMKSERHSSSTASSTPRTRGDKASTTVDRTCMATAVTAREVTVRTAWMNFTASMTTSFDKRSAALIAAWNASADGSKTAVKTAWTDWKNEKRAAHTKLKADRKEAWDLFHSTAKESCKATVPKDEGLERAGSDSIAL